MSRHLRASVNLVLILYGDLLPDQRLRSHLFQASVRNLAHRRRGVRWLSHFIRAGMAYTILKRDSSGDGGYRARVANHP